MSKTENEWKARAEAMRDVVDMACAELVEASLLGKVDNVESIEMVVTVNGKEELLAEIGRCVWQEEKEKGE